MTDRRSQGFRLIDGMFLVACTAVGFGLSKGDVRSMQGFSTFGGRWEAWLLEASRRTVPVVGMWTIGLIAIAARGALARRRMGVARAFRLRRPGLAACLAAAAAGAAITLVSGFFYTFHLLEDARVVRKFLSHPTAMHRPPPFGDGPIEEVIGAAVIGAWAVLACTGRWRPEPTWLDRAGRAIGATWIGLFLIYVYAFNG